MAGICNTLALSQPSGDQNDPNYQSGWDLYVDASGNIAVHTGGIALAQDVASAARTFLGEVWYNTTIGVPLFQQILGYLPSLAFIKAALTAAANTVPGLDGVAGSSIASVAVFLIGLGPSRRLGGQIQITPADGSPVVVAGTASIQTVSDPWYVNQARDGAEYP